MKHFLTTAALSLCMTTGAYASTVSVDIDFTVLVASIGEQGVEGRTFNFGGLDVTITSSHDAYLDSAHYSPSRPSGLGVCSSGLTPALQCSVASDDHVTTSAETLTLTFSHGIDNMTNFMFRGRRHVDLTGSTDALEYGFTDGSGTQTGLMSTFADLGTDITGGATSPITSFSLSADQTAFYLSSLRVEYTAPVPLPASVLLLGGAVAGLGAMRRRRKTA